MIDFEFGLIIGGFWIIAMACQFASYLCAPRETFFVSMLNVTILSIFFLVAMTEF